MKWIQKCKQIDRGIAVLALVLLIAVTFAGVVFRYVFSKPFSWRRQPLIRVVHRINGNPGFLKPL